MPSHEIEIHLTDGKRHVAVCSCGRWQSNKYLLRSEAESYGEAHVWRGDAHLTALAQFDRNGKPSLKAELKWYEEQSENMFLSEKDRDMWAQLANELRPRVQQRPTGEDQEPLFFL